jgi:hypothetical protein
MPIVDGTTVSRPDDSDAVTNNDNYGGIVITPNTDLKGVTAEVSTNTNSVSTMYLTDTSNTTLDSASVFGGGDEATLSADLSAGTKYYIYVDEVGATFTLGYAFDPSYPFTSDDVDIVAGVREGLGEDTGFAWGVNDVTARLQSPENTTLSITDTTDTTADLSVDSDFSDSYTIYRGESSGFATDATHEVGTIGSGGAQTFTDTGLTQGKTYYWVAEAENDNGTTQQSSEQSATTVGPAPSAVSVTNADSNDDLPADDADLSWTLNSTDETGVRVERSRDGGTSWGAVTTLAAGTESDSDTGLLDGEAYVWRVVAEFEDVESAGVASPSTTTALPDTTVNAITPIDASVEDELTLPNADVADYGDVRYQIRVAGSGDPYGSDVVVSQGGSDATFTGLADGEKYGIRARSETEHADGTYTEVTEITKLPSPSVTLSAAATSVTLGITDNADNEDAITVDRRREYTDGFGGWAEIASLVPDATSYTDDTVLPGTTYDYRVTNETEHVMSATVVTTTTDSLRPRDRAPTSGWYVEVDTPSGTRRPTIVGEPQREPALNNLEAVSIPVPKDAVWSEPAFDDAPVRVWYDGERLPIEELQSVEQRPGRTILYAEGGTELYVPDRYEFSNTDVHAAFGDVVADTPYTATITTPDASNREFDTVDDDEVFRDYLESTAETFPVVTDGGDLRPAQTNFWVEAEDESNSGVTENVDFPDGDPQWSGAQAVDIVGNAVSFTITTEHKIAADDFTLAARFSTAGPPDGDDVEGFDGEVVTELDGTAVSGLIFDDSTVTKTLITLSPGTTSGVTSDVAAGSHTIQLSVEDAGVGINGSFYLDGVAVYDGSRHDLSNWSLETWDNREYYNDPPLFPSGGLDVLLLHEGFLSATGARVEASFDDLSGDQALALSNDYGSTYTTASNTDVLETDFASPGADIQMRVTLDAYGSRQITTPLQNYRGQTLQEYTLFEDVRDSPPLQNDQFSGNREAILTDLVQRGDALWGLSWDHDAEEIVVEMTNAGDRVSGHDLNLADYQWSTETLGRQVEWADIRGGAQTVRAEEFAADTVNEVALAHDNLIAGREQVRDADSGQVYTRGTDYEINYLLGNITAASDGGISDGQSLVIDYEWKPKGEFAAGGADAKKKLVRTFVGANTDAICRSIAYYLVQELGEPIESGTATISELPPGVSVLEALSASALPQRGDWTLRGAPTVQDGRVQLPIANRQRVEDVVSDIQGRLDQHGERI